MWNPYGKYLGSTWEVYGIHMGNMCNVSEKDMGPIINPIWDPFKTHFHSLCGSHMGPIIQPTWIPYMGATYTCCLGYWVCLWEYQNWNTWQRGCARISHSMCMPQCFVMLVVEQLLSPHIYRLVSVVTVILCIHVHSETACITWLGWANTHPNTSGVSSGYQGRSTVNDFEHNTARNI